MTTPEFFDQLNEGDEYLSILCTKQIYSKIPSELLDVMSISSVRQKNESFKDDLEHKELVKGLSRAKKELQNYEYYKNNK